MSLLVALVVGAAVAPVAQAEGLHRTSIGIRCVATAVEATEVQQSCETIVEDGSPEPTPPTGVMTLNHAITCTLAPGSAYGSTCDFLLTTPPGKDFTLSGEYSGDTTHAHSEVVMEWDVAVDDPGQEVRVPPVFVPLAYLVAPPKAESTPSDATPAPTPSAAKEVHPRIIARPATRTHQRLARFRFAGGGRFECRLDGGPYRPCGAVFRHRVATGVHVLRVRPAGGGPVTSFAWRVLGRR
jgi:hypothetical protein